MIAKSVLLRPQVRRPRARAPTCYATGKSVQQARYKIKITLQVFSSLTFFSFQLKFTLVMRPKIIYIIQSTVDNI